MLWDCRDDECEANIYSKTYTEGSCLIGIMQGIALVDEYSYIGKI